MRCNLKTHKFIKLLYEIYNIRIYDWKQSDILLRYNKANVKT